MKYVLRLSDDQTFCRFCNQRDKLDKSVHVIESCDYFNVWKMKIFGTFRMDLKNTDLDTDKLLKFIKMNEILRTRIMTWTESLQETQQKIWEKKK